MRCAATLPMLLLLGLGGGRALPAQTEPAIDKDRISVHPVRRGNMPIRLMPGAEVTSLTPPEVLALVPPDTMPSPQVSQPASVQVAGGRVIVGTVRDIDRGTLLDAWKITIRLSEPLPDGLKPGAKLATLIEVGLLKDTIYLERPASAHTGTEMPLFVLEPNGAFARRTTVRFGRQSGALIQVISGLMPGDLVIVTDTSAYNSYPRIRIQ